MFKKKYDSSGPPYISRLPYNCRGLRSQQDVNSSVPTICIATLFTGVSTGECPECRISLKNFQGDVILPDFNQPVAGTFDNKYFPGSTK